MSEFGYFLAGAGIGLAVGFHSGGTMASYHLEGRGLERPVATQNGVANKSCFEQFLASAVSI